MAVFFKDSNGNLFTSATPGAGAPEGFELVQANSTDAAQEKHRPGRRGRARRASAPRAGRRDRAPHGEGALHRVDRPRRRRPSRDTILKPGQTPLTFFAGNVKSGRVYAYCNLHGLWVKEF